MIRHLVILFICLQSILITALPSSPYTTQYELSRRELPRLRARDNLLRRQAAVLARRSDTWTSTEAESLAYEARLRRRSHLSKRSPSDHVSSHSSHSSGSPSRSGSVSGNFNKPLPVLPLHENAHTPTSGHKPTLARTKTDLKPVDQKASSSGSSTKGKGKAVEPPAKASGSGSQGKGKATAQKAPLNPGAPESKPQSKSAKRRARQRAAKAAKATGNSEENRSEAKEPAEKKAEVSKPKEQKAEEKKHEEKKPEEKKPEEKKAVKSWYERSKEAKERDTQNKILEDDQKKKSKISKIGDSIKNVFKSKDRKAYEFQMKYQIHAPMTPGGIASMMDKEYKKAHKITHSEVNFQHWRSKEYEKTAERNKNYATVMGQEKTAYDNNMKYITTGAQLVGAATGTVGAGAGLGNVLHAFNVVGR